MIKNSTYYLLKHLYAETEPTEILAVEEALAQNLSLQETFLSWLELFTLLNEAKVKPSNALVNNILLYSKKHALETL